MCATLPGINQLLSSNKKINAACWPSACQKKHKKNLNSHNQKMQKTDESPERKLAIGMSSKKTSVDLTFIIYLK